MNFSTHVLLNVCRLSVQHTAQGSFKAHTVAVYGRSVIDLTVAKALSPFIIF